MGNFFVALIIAFFLAAFIQSFFKYKGPWNSFWSLFFVLFLFSWASSLWLVPVGPSVLGTYWITALVATVLLILVLAAAAPPRKNRHIEIVDENEAREKLEIPLHSNEGKESTAIAIGVLFWILIAALVLSVVWGHF